MPKDFENKYDFSNHIRKVLKQVHPDTGINSHAMININNMMHHVADKLIKRLDTLKGNRSVLNSRDVQYSVRMEIPAELGRHAVSELNKAVTRYTSTESGDRNNRVTRTQRAGLVFPPALVENILRDKMSYNRLGATAPVAMAGVLEYLAAEILELSGNSARDNNRTRITPRDVMLGIRNDGELDRLFDGVTNGGVLQNIHSVLLPRKN